MFDTSCAVNVPASASARPSSRPRPSPCDVIKLGLTRRDQRAQQVGLSLHDLLFDLIVALGRSWRLRPLRPEARAWSDDARMMMACASAWQVRLPGRGTVCKEK